MYYSDYFRDSQPEDFENLDEFADFEEFEEFEDESRLSDFDSLPCCPYRQFMPPPPPGQHQGPGGPFGTPPGQHQGPGGPPPGGQGTHGMAPSGPPPSYTPHKQPAQYGVQPQFVEPGTIRRCTFRYVYIWPYRGRGFWAWLIYVGRRSVSGYRWTGYRWVYFGMDLRQIESFECY
ncbi:MAG: hypothetical protein Q8936_13610 [Bacillota bacterium]|nr:hypothetical protein [Bacillota bacterium]